MDEHKFTDDQINWFAERIDESGTGLLMVNSYLVKKYRKITGNEHDSNSAIRSSIICITNDGLGTG